nr:N-acetylmuramoyl-L-alanine amidase [Oceaniovalibus guishaninsula]
MIVLHYTAMASAEAALDRLCDPVAQVSAHWLIAEDGRLFRLVPEDRRAWHAGAGAWGAVTDVNSHSLGVELANDGAAPFPAPQMAALESLLRGTMARWRIPPAGIIGHSDCAPCRKADPGPRFDWARLARNGLALPTPQGCADGDDAAFVAAMRRAGYTATGDLPHLLAALRLRHRPWAKGPRDARDTGIALGLAARLPVDPARSPA